MEKVRPLLSLPLVTTVCGCLAFWVVSVSVPINAASMQGCVVLWMTVWPPSPTHRCAAPPQLGNPFQPQVMFPEPSSDCVSSHPLIHSLIPAQPCPVQSGLDLSSSFPQDLLSQAPTRPRQPEPTADPWLSPPTGSDQFPGVRALLMPSTRSLHLLFRHLLLKPLPRAPSPVLLFPDSGSTPWSQSHPLSHPPPSHTDTQTSQGSPPVGLYPALSALPPFPPSHVHNPPTPAPHSLQPSGSLVLTCGSGPGMSPGVQSPDQAGSSLRKFQEVSASGSDCPHLPGWGSRTRQVWDGWMASGSWQSMRRHQPCWTPLHFSIWRTDGLSPFWVDVHLPARSAAFPWEEKLRLCVLMIPHFSPQRAGAPLRGLLASPESSGAAV